MRVGMGEGGGRVWTGEEVVWGVIVGVVVIESPAVWRACKGNVALGARIKSCRLGEFVIEARQPSVFVDDTLTCMGKIVEGGAQRARSSAVVVHNRAIGKSRVRKNEVRGAA